MPYARVNKIDIYYEVHGFGDPALLIPGLGSDANSWQPFIEPFRDRYQMIAIENRGSGRSSRPPGPYSTVQMAEEAVAVLNHLGINRCHILSKSMGGMIAQIIAAQYPEKVRSLVLSSTLLKHDSYGHELLELGRLIAEKAGLFATYRQAFLLSYSREYCMRSQGRLKEVETMLKGIDESELVKGYIGQSIACQEHDSRALAPRIKAPSLVIVGQDDMITTPEQSRSLAAAIPKSELIITPRGGHGFWREFPEDVNPVVVDFLERN